MKRPNTNSSRTSYVRMVQITILLFLGAMGIFSLFYSAPVVLGRNLADEPLLAETNSTGPLVRNDPSVLRKRFVTVNLGLLSGSELDKPSSVRQRLSLNLFADATFNARLDRTTPTRYGHAWVGHIEGIALSSAIFVVVDGIVAGSVAMPGASYLVEYAGNGIHAVYQLEDALLPPDGPALFPGEDAPASAQAHGGPQASETPIAAPAVDDGSVTDVMVVYTPRAQQNAGGTSAIQAAIDLMVTTTNQAYVNSGINTSLNLVHTEEVAYTEDGTANDLYNLTYTGVNYPAMDSVHTTRNTYGADLVALITDPASISYCGIAWLGGGESFAFSVTLRQCGGLTFAHELGHNQGAHHDWYVDPVPGAYTYSHGHVNVSALFRTIMAYPNKCQAAGVSCTRITYFSNPNVNFAGVPTGVTPGTNLSCTLNNLNNPDCDADNRLTLNNTAFSVANYRESLAPDAPSNLTTTAISYIQIDPSWQDNSTNETGFRIERKLGASGTYAEIATVGAGVTTYSDLGLVPNTQYCYRVRAYTGTSNSGYTTESCTTTPSTVSSALLRVHRTTGLVITDGSLNCGLTGSSTPVAPCFNASIGADLAERIDVSEQVGPGDVIEPDPDNPKRYRKTRVAQSAGVAGVISSQPGMTLNNTREEQASLATKQREDDWWMLPFSLVLSQQWHEANLSLSWTLASLGRITQLEHISIAQLSDRTAPRDGRPLLALAGRVYVKATTENGPIRPGDLLTSSSRVGYAMRCTAACESTTLGKALEELRAGDGLILVLVMSR